MVQLKEDGSLDIERINRLPLEEHMKEVGSFTREQFRQYVSTIPINESKTATRAVKVNYTLEEDLERGCVIVGDFMNEMREKYGKKLGC